MVRQKIYHTFLPQGKIHQLKKKHFERIKNSPFYHRESYLRLILTSVGDVRRIFSTGVVDIQCGATYIYSIDGRTRGLRAAI